MSNDQNIDRLIEVFPKGQDRRAALEWLLKVFELWDGGTNGEVTAKANQIAPLVGRTYRVLPNPGLPEQPPNHQPGDADAAQWLLVYAINALRESDLALIDIHCWYFVEETRHWLGQTTR